MIEITDVSEVEQEVEEATKIDIKRTNLKKKINLFFHSLKDKQEKSTEVELRTGTEPPSETSRKRHRDCIVVLILYKYIYNAIASFFKR